MMEKYINDSISKKRLFLEERMIKTHTIKPKIDANYIKSKTYIDSLQRIKHKNDSIQKLKAKKDSTKTN